MKNNVLCFCFLVFSAAGIFPTKASESTLAISGDVVASGCEVDSSKTVQIGSFSGKDFPSVGSNSAFKAMNINLSNCYTKLASVSVKFSGTPDANNPVLLALSETETGATLKQEQLSLQVLVLSCWTTGAKPYLLINPNRRHFHWMRERIRSPFCCVTNQQNIL